MSLNDKTDLILQRVRFYQIDLLDSFPKRKNAILQLVEALACAERASSPVELSLTPAFQRTYSDISNAIDAMTPRSGTDTQPTPNASFNQTKKKKTSPTLLSFLDQTRKWTCIFSKLLPKETHRPFKLYAIDATSNPKPHAKTLDDRCFVHCATQVGTPVTIGLQASVLVAIPEKMENEASWTLPLSVERISSIETPCEVAERQLKELTRVSQTGSLCVITADSGYTSLKPQTSDQVIIARSRIDRTGRRLYVNKDEGQSKKGRPRMYEENIIRFSENIPQGEERGPDEEIDFESMYNGKEVNVFISRWKNISVSGHSELVDIVKVEIFLKSDSSIMLFEHPMLLQVTGARRNELTSQHIYESYLARFKIEHFFRFQKQQLLFCKYQTADLQRQINWWWICFMSYWLLYLVRGIAPDLSRPWMPKRCQSRTASPGEVKRVFGSHIFPRIGSPSEKPLSRGISSGRKKGTVLPKRERKKPIKKSNKSQKEPCKSLNERAA